MSDVRDAGYDDWLDAIAEGAGYYFKCENSHGSLPPQRACPYCGSQALAEEPLPETGEIETFTVVQVATPAFTDDTPYVTAIASFGAVRLTGLARGVDTADVEVGMAVTATVETTETTGERVLVLRPR